ncbi:hypothetical protein AAFC00_002518 [Neodothiora populina]|uniref:Plastocyanin-like domain-containing protein n=1 Tax=Neodothiora populina TaxID=2781224 RepID=A0ABR3P7H8_9PEZI
MVQVLFVNKLPNNYASMHSMGMYYGKQYEGSTYPNTTTGTSPSVQEQDAVPPGGCAVYKWLVSEAQAPAPGQDSRLWSYHSYVNMPADVSAGLSGPMYIYRQGKIDSIMSSHREFLVTFNTHYESKSFLAGVNAERAGLNLSSLQKTNTLIGQPHVGNESFWVPQLTDFPPVSLTQEQGPIFYSMNGYILSNGAPYEMCRDDPVVWYIMAYGEASHVFHMHGHNFKYLDQ